MTPPDVMKRENEKKRSKLRNFSLGALILEIFAARIMELRDARDMHVYCCGAVTGAAHFGAVYDCVHPVYNAFTT